MLILGLPSGIKKIGIKTNKKKLDRFLVVFTAHDEEFILKKENWIEKEEGVRRKWINWIRGIRGRREIEKKRKRCKKREKKREKEKRRRLKEKVNKKKKTRMREKKLFWILL